MMVRFSMLVASLATKMRFSMLVASLATTSARDRCVFNATDARCESAAYRGQYPLCALFQYADRSPIPCRGLVDADACDADKSATPEAASWHVHVFFPNVDCGNCSGHFTREAANFTFAGAMRLRRDLAAFFNADAAHLDAPIDEARALRDPAYDECIDTFGLVAGAPAKYHPSPCIYEVDAVKEMGPFTNPATGLGYPNWSFLIPSDFWAPGLRDRTVAWFERRRERGDGGAYDVLFHPNTGCEARDHVDASSPDIRWLGERRPLDAAIFSCNALGCNQACPSDRGPPADCGTSSI